MDANNYRVPAVSRAGLFQVVPGLCAQTNSEFHLVCSDLFFMRFIFHWCAPFSPSLWHPLAFFVFIFMLQGTRLTRATLRVDSIWFPGWAVVHRKGKHQALECELCSVCAVRAPLWAGQGGGHVRAVCGRFLQILCPLCFAKSGVTYNAPGSSSSECRCLQAAWVT